MAVHRPLALCVGLACFAIAHGAAVAADAGPHAATQAQQLERIGQYRDQARWVDALGEIERALQQRPQDPLLLKLQVLTLGDIGNAYRAWQLYRQHPELFDDAQRDRIETDLLAKRIGWGLAYAPDEDSRLSEAGQALAQTDQYLQAQGLELQQAPPRLRLDRLVLLNRLARHQQVRTEYQTLLAQGVDIPDYVLPAVGSSLLAGRHPEEAIPVLQRATATAGSDEYGSRSELAYAYLESERAEQALQQLQQWQDDEPTWRWGGGQEPFANWARYEADLNLALVRAYSGDLPTAQAELEQQLAYAPGNSGLQTALGSVYQLRGWPRAALQRHQIAYSREPREIAPRIGIVEAQVALQRDDLARPLHDELLAGYPEQPSVQRMHEQWRMHRGWQLYAHVEGGHSSGGGGSSPLGNDDLHYGIEVASPLLDDRWRLLALADRRAVDFQDQRSDPLWLGAGVSYRFGRLDAQAMVLRANDDVGATGLRGGIGWQFNDRWHAGLQAVRNDPDASLQARAAGISADSLSLAVDYRRDERTAVGLGAARYRYDDGNHREVLSATVEQRLLTRPRWFLDGLGGAYASRGSRGDVPYFNPRRDRSLEMGLRLDQQLWRRYERHLRHRFTVSLGDYWQQGHGSAWVPTLGYRHEWQFGTGRVLEYGVSWSRPVYDGRRERHIGFDAALHWGE